MKTFNVCLSLLAVAAIGSLAGCSSTNAASVPATIRTSLDQAGLKNVSAREDKGKGVVTLAGTVTSADDKARAQSIAQPLAGSEVVSNQIAVIPPGGGSEARTLNSDFDKGIEGNLDAALITANLHGSVSCSVKNQVVTLTGNVDSQTKRAQAESVATTVPNVQQVVNELQVKDQKATTSQ